MAKLRQLNSAGFLGVGYDIMKGSLSVVVMARKKSLLRYDITVMIYPIGKRWLTKYAN